MCGVARGEFVPLRTSRLLPNFWYPSLQGRGLVEAREMTSIGSTAGPEEARASSSSAIEPRDAGREVHGENSEVEEVEEEEVVVTAFAANGGFTAEFGPAELGPLSIKLGSLPYKACREATRLSLQGRAAEGPNFCSCSFQPRCAATAKIPSTTKRWMSWFRNVDSSIRSGGVKKPVIRMSLWRFTRLVLPPPPMIFSITTVTDCWTSFCSTRRPPRALACFCSHSTCRTRSTMRMPRSWCRHSAVPTKAVGKITATRLHSARVVYPREVATLFTVPSGVSSDVWSRVALPQRTRVGSRVNASRNPGVVRS
eukprot:RCo017492